MDDEPDDDDVQGALEAARWRDYLRRGPESAEMPEAAIFAIPARYLLRVMMNDPAACPRCHGAGLVVRIEQQIVSWLYFALLAPPANIWVISGQLRPMICRRCGGTGEREPTKPEVEGKPNDV
jgi:hypothetical protein